MLRPESFWTGTSSKLISVTVQHWCEKADANLQSFLQLKRKTEADAIEAWNTRATIDDHRIVPLDLLKKLLEESQDAKVAKSVRAIIKDGP